MANDVLEILEVNYTVTETIMDREYLYDNLFAIYGISEEYYYISICRIGNKRNGLQRGG